MLLFGASPPQMSPPAAVLNMNNSGTTPDSRRENPDESRHSLENTRATSGGRMGNLVQSITRSDTVICPRCHINCLGAGKHCVPLCSIMLPFLVFHKVPGFCATRMMTPARNTSQDFIISSMCVFMYAGVHFSEASEMLTGSVSHLSDLYIHCSYVEE